MNVADRNGCSALIWASKNGYDQCLELLMSAGADVNHRDNDKCTALDWARCNNFTRCVERLLNVDMESIIAAKCKSMPLVRRGLTPLVLLLVRHSKYTNAPLLVRRLPSSVKVREVKCVFPETPLLCALFYLKGPAPCYYWPAVT